MKKWLKIVLIVVGTFTLCVVLDIVSIYTKNKPIFIFDRDKCGCFDKSYYGLLYDTFYCSNEDKVYIKFKGNKFSCINSDNKNIIVGKITEIKDNYIFMVGLSNNNYIKNNSEAHISLSNNPTIKGANNLIVGQYIKIVPINIQEAYPPFITTNTIEITDRNTEKSKAIDIIDKTKTENIPCAEALEKFYEDDEYEYYFSCIKNDYIIVKYENGYQETIKSAFEYSAVSITDLDKYNIDYSKKEKEIQICIIESDNKGLQKSTITNNETKESYNIYYYGVEATIQIGNNKYDLIKSLSSKKTTLKKVLETTDKVDVYKDGGSILYRSKLNHYSDNNHQYTILLCNTIDGNRDIYIGNKDMEYEDNFCK